MSNLNSAIVGSLIHTVEFGRLELIEKGVIVFSQKGIIVDVIDLNKFPTYLGSRLFLKVFEFSGKIIVPGFIDAHCHAPQYVFTGTGMDLPLLEWLEKYTFPCEARFSDSEFAQLAYYTSVSRHLKCGTTFASYFATIHNNASKILVDVINELGQRAFVGKVSMDCNCPETYSEQTENACEDAEEFIVHVLSQTEVGKAFLANMTREMMCEVNSSSSLQSDSNVKIFAKGSPTGVTANLSPSAKLRQKDIWNESIVATETETVSLLNNVDTPLVMPCITPRFVPTCSSTLMTQLGKISAKYSLPVQSHLSESVNEIEWVASLYPDCDTYAAVYDQHGLLHERSYMAHCCHSNEIEQHLLASKKCGVVHCASSNFMLSSGVMDVRSFLDKGIKVGLGTDVAGGYSPSMLDAMRQCIVASRVKGMEMNNNHTTIDIERIVDGDNTDSHLCDDITKEYKPINWKEAFHLATVGSAEVLNMDKVVGNFLIGKKLDCLVIDVHCVDSPIDIFEGESILQQFEKFLFLGDDRNIQNVFVNGVQLI